MCYIYNIKQTVKSEYIMTTLNEQMTNELLLSNAKAALSAGKLDNFEKMFIIRIQNWSGNRLAGELNLREFKYLCTISEK
jgi:hypothetical protein